MTARQGPCALGSLGDRAANVLTRLYATRVAGPDRVRCQAFHRTVANAGWALGGLAAAAALPPLGTSTPYRWLLTGDALSFAAAALLTLRCGEPPSPSRIVAASTDKPGPPPGPPTPGATAPTSPTSPPRGCSSSRHRLQDRPAPHATVSRALSVALAPAASQGTYLGVHGLAQSVQRSLGPLAVTAAIAAGPPGWTAFGTTIAVTCAFQHRLVRDRLRRTPLSVLPVTVSEH